MRAAIKRLKLRIQKWPKRCLALLDKVIVIRLPERHADFVKATALIDRICPNASPTEIMVTWRDIMLRRGKCGSDEFRKALDTSWDNSLQGDWWYKRFGRSIHNAGMAETIAAHMQHFQTEEQIAQAEDQSRDRVRGAAARALYFEMQKVPANIRPQVIQGVLEELDRRSQTGA